MKNLKKIGLIIIIMMITSVVTLAGNTKGSVKKDAFAKERDSAEKAFKNLNLEVNFTDVVIPLKPKDTSFDYKLVFIPSKEILLGMKNKKMEIDDDAIENDRNPTANAYAIWLALPTNTQVADSVFKDWIDGTVLECRLLEIEYNLNIPLVCGGSNFKDSGLVPFLPQKGSMAIPSFIKKK